MRLNELKIGESARIDIIGGEGALRQHFLDMGLVPGANATLVRLAPLGDPMELNVRGYELSIRKNEAESIEVR
jgi:ferrous iron transport protein B